MSSAKPPVTAPETASLLSLPTELHILILSHLSYPSALAFRHAHPQFYPLLSPNANIRLKVAWLIHLAENAATYGLDPDCPFKYGVSLKSDAEFCQSIEIRRILKALGIEVDILMAEKSRTSMLGWRRRNGNMAREAWVGWGRLLFSAIVVVLAIAIMMFRSMDLGSHVLFL